MSDFDEFEEILKQFTEKEEIKEDIKKLDDFIDDILLIKSFNKFNSKYGESFIVLVKSKKQNKEFKIFSNKRLTNYLNKIENTNKLNKNKYIYDIKNDEFNGHKFISFKIC